MRVLKGVGGTLLFLAAAAVAQASRPMRFVVVDSAGKEIKDAIVTVQDPTGAHAPLMIASDGFDPAVWEISYKTEPNSARTNPIRVVLPLNHAVTINIERQQDQIPTKEITIRVVATRLRQAAASATQGVQRTNTDIKKFTSTTGASGSNALVQGQAGVASDSAGQQHVRGEHAEITYVVDGVPLPDTLSGRAGAIVVPSTVDTVDIIEGGFAPEFGGQTAAILNIATLPGARKFKGDLDIDGGTFNTFNGDLTMVGPLGPKANFTFDLQGSRTGVYNEPQQPDIQTAHNTGAYWSIFSKARISASSKDTLTLTLSHNPDRYQANNRTGLPASFADVGEGFGFLGNRNADGTIPAPANPGGLGDQTLPLPSQQAAGMDIDVSEMNEFAILNWRHQINAATSAQVALTGLHSGQEVTNTNPAVDVLNLPIDNSIEYNPDATRNAHHLQLNGSISSQKGSHSLKMGFLVDRETGHESYQITPASQLALDALADLDPTLVPAGAAETDAAGNPVLDVNGHPVYKPTSSVVPKLKVDREGWYDAAFLQDTWRISKRFTANYGLRWDWYFQRATLQPNPVSQALISPRLNFQYGLGRRDILRWSYNKLFNTPPLAQGAIIGAPIVPETLDQYDVSLQHDLGHGQDLKVAYYVKQMKNQVDTGLLVPGSQIGLYSAVNFERGGVHGVEVSYDLFAPKGVGWDGYLNWSHSMAAPNGVDNTGANVPDYNDHDQRDSVGAGLAHTWKNQASAALTFQYGSGLASSIVRDNKRTPREQTDFRYSSSPKLFHGHGGFGFSVENLFDERKVINFQSGFSGTRFMTGRRFTLSLFASF